MNCKKCGAAVSNEDLFCKACGTPVNEVNNMAATETNANPFAQTTPEKALYGFLLKHLVSLNDMIVSGEKYSKELWLEKITDIENYLILLLGLLEDDKMFKKVEKK